MWDGGGWTARRRSWLSSAVGVGMLAIAAQPLNGGPGAEAATTTGLAQLAPSIRVPFCELIRSLQASLGRFPSAERALASVSQSLGCAALPPVGTTTSTSLGATTTTLFVPGSTSTTGTGPPTTSTTLPLCGANPPPTTVPCASTTTTQTVVSTTSTTVCHPADPFATTLPCGAPTGPATTTSTTLRPGP